MAEIIFVFGGSGSGKSMFAEELSGSEKGKKYYIATMKVYGEEGQKKVMAHQKQRADKGFETLEIEKYLGSAHIEKNSTVLIECMGNLCANYLFEGEEKTAEDCFLEIKNELSRLEEKAKKIVIVSNDVFSDGIKYSEETEEYIRLLSLVNKWIFEKSKTAAECVYSIAVYHKGGEV